MSQNSMDARNEHNEEVAKKQPTESAIREALLQLRRLGHDLRVVDAAAVVREDRDTNEPG